MTKPTIAILGTNGALGKPILEQLTSPEFSKNLNLPIVAITRDASKKTNTDSIIYKEATYEDYDALQKAFEGVDVLVNAGAWTVDFTNLINAAVKQGVKLYIPSQFGVDVTKFTKYFSFLDKKLENSAKARAAGLKTVDIPTSLFAQPGSFLYENIQSFGYDENTKTVTYYLDENEPVPYTRLEDIGKVIAVLATKDPSTIPDIVRIYSGKITSEEAVKAYEARKNIKIKREHKDPQEALQKAQAKLKEHGFRGEDFLEYLHTALGLGTAAGVNFTEDAREFINPNESVFKWTKF